MLHSSILVIMMMTSTLVTCERFRDRWDHWWSYESVSGPKMWGKIVPDYNLCSSGKQQSPIDIRMADLLYDPNLKHVKIENLPVNGHLINTGNDITFQLDNDYSTVVNISEGPLSYVYHVAAIKFHFSKTDLKGSEHKIAGRSFPAEMQIIGFNGNLYNNMSKAENSSNGIVILSAFLSTQTPSEGSFPNSALNVFVNGFSAIQEINTSVKLKHFNILDLLPATNDYITYEGSMTQPSCQETVTWVIYNKPTYITEKQLKAFRDVPMEWVIKNTRPLMPVNHRVIRTNVESKKQNVTQSQPTQATQETTQPPPMLPNSQIPRPFRCNITTRRSTQNDIKQPVV